MDYLGYMATTENHKTIRFSKKTDIKLQAIAGKCGLSKLDFFTYMVDYFYKTKKDPRDLNDDLLKNAINRKTDNIVAFIRTQEQELLIPIKKETEGLSAVTNVILEKLEQDLIAHHIQQGEAYAGQVNNINRVIDFLNRLDTAQLDKKRLKKHFSAILEFYIATREQMGMMSRQADKDAVIQNVRLQLESL